MATRLMKGKIAGIDACANKNGVIAAAAMDQRGSLQKAIAKARGAPATPEDLSQFKVAVSKVLTRQATAILLDTEFGTKAIAARAPGTGVL
ncbi:MAG: tagatose 1,6-diphosphate aldolase, partial [Spirochaetia bacterium]